MRFIFIATLLACLGLPADALVSAEQGTTPFIFRPPADFSGGNVSDTVDAITDGTGQSTDDTVSGDLDVTAIFADEAVAANQSIEVTIELLGGATFLAEPVMGDLWDGNSSVTFSKPNFSTAVGQSTAVFRGSSEDGLGPLNRLAIDVRGLTIVDTAPIDMRITVMNLGSGFAEDKLVRTIRTPYIRFVGNQPIDVDGVIEPLIYATESQSTVINDSVNTFTDGTALGVDDTVSGIMDLTGTIGEAIPENVNLIFKLNLSSNATFSQKPGVGELWDGNSSQPASFLRGSIGSDFAEISIASGDGFGADSEFAIDIRGINISDQEDVFLTIQIERSDGSASFPVRRVVVPYLRFRNAIEVSVSPNPGADAIDVSQDSLFFDGSLGDSSAEIGTVEIFSRDRLHPNGGWRLQISDVLQSLSYELEGANGLSAFSQSGGSVLFGETAATSFGFSSNSANGAAANLTIYPAAGILPITVNVPVDNLRPIENTNAIMRLNGVSRSGFSNSTIVKTGSLSPISAGDADSDGVVDTADNCPEVKNAGQLDSDSDGIGDDCDSDRDGDGVLNALDNCPTLSNVDQSPSQAIAGLGSACDVDTDGDGVFDEVDVFRSDVLEWADQDGDSVGDNADEDASFSAVAYLVTTSNSINITRLHIINSSTVPQRFTGTLYNRDGGRLGEPNTNLHAGVIGPDARIILNSSDLESIFATTPWQGPAMLEVSGTGDFNLMSKLVSPSGLISNTNCVAEKVVHNVDGSDSSAQSFVRLINTGESLINNVKAEMRDQQGNRIGEAGVEIARFLRSKQAIFLSKPDLESFFGTWSGEASFEVLNSSPAIKLLNLNFVNNETYFNFSCFESEDSSSVYLMTTSQSNNISETHLINTTETPVSLNGSLYQRDGSRLGPTGVNLSSTTIAPYGRLVLSATDLENLFGIAPWLGPALLEVSGSEKLGLLTKLRSPSGLVSNTNCVRSGDVHNIEGSDSSVVSYVRLINQGTSLIDQVSGTLFDRGGQILGNEYSIIARDLEPKQALFLSQRELSELFGEWEGEASLVLNADHLPDLKLLNLNLVNSETFFNFSCYERARQN